MFYSVMFAFQNTQLHLIRPKNSYRKLLKFCYFLIALAFLNCGESKKTSQSPESQSSGEQITDGSLENNTKTILCFGDSITAGYGLDDTNEAYPGVLQQVLDSLGFNYTVVNSGVSGETTAGGNSRINWVMKQNVDIFLLELGGNDGLRGIPLTETKSNLQDIINKVKSNQPQAEIILAGMELPPNMGQDYTAQFRNVFSDIALQNDITFIPFILKDVGGIKELNQSDGIHPTAEGHRIIAKTVWEVLEPMLLK